MEGDQDILVLNVCVHVHFFRKKQVDVNDLFTVLNATSA